MNLTPLIGRIMFLVLLLSLIAGCEDTGQDPDSGPQPDAVVAADGPAPDSLAPDSAPPWKQPFDPAVCKMTPYKWLAPSTMGKVVTREKSLLFSLPKAALEAMLKLSDYKDAVTIKYGAVVYMVRYETQDRGKRVEATAAVAFPDLPAGKTLKAPHVLWLHGTTGFSDKCAPTRKGADAALPAALMASQGYIGVAPDFLGMIGFGKASTMPHPYLVSEATALASLDSLRAAGSVVKELSKQVTADPRVVAWGASQGGHATLAALLYAPYYAAEYTMTAGLALIPPADVQGQTVAALLAFNDATVGVAGTATSLARWYGHQGDLAKVLTDTDPHHLATALPKLMDTECGLDKKKYNLQKVTDVFTQKFIDAATQKSWQGFDSWRCMFAENSFTYTSVKRKGDAPILYVVGEKDELVNPAVQRKSFDAMCKAGYKMEYIECKGADHVSGALWSLPEQFAWVEDRLAGKALGSDTCKRSQPVCCKGSTKAPCKKQ